MVGEREEFRLVPLIALAAFALTLGGAFYVLIRDPRAFYLTDLSGLSFPSPPRPSLPPVAASLPTAIHVFAFSLITAPLLRFRYAAVIASVFWACTNNIFELLQVADACPALLARSGHILARVFCTYVVNGTFDVLDLGSAWLGSGVAYLVLGRLLRKTED